MKFAAVVVGSLLVACSSSSTTGTACTVAGTYALLEKVDTSQPNSCGFKDDTSPSTITVDASGGVVFQGATGSCPGAISGCTLQASCQASTASGPITVQLDWTFDAKGFTGTDDVGSINSPKCKSSLLDTATRK